MVDLTASRVGVTGATGFLGRHLVRALERAGARVVGLVRRPDRGADLVERGVELRRADLCDETSLREALAGLDAVVSNASIAVTRAPRGSVADHAQLEARTIRGLARAALHRGIRRFVHISSVAVYRRVPLGRPGVEDDPRRGARRNLASWFFVRGYGEAKAAAEEALWNEPDLALTVLRPG
ncbi:MAG: NAD(P)H-binding protein, partial [Myxococcota bacterium]